MSDVSRGKGSSIDTAWIARLFEHGARMETLDRFVETVATALGVSVATITIPVGDRMKSYGAVGTPALDCPRSDSVSDLVVTSGELLVIEDIRDCVGRRAASPAIAKGFRLYAGAPILSPDGGTIGSLNVLHRGRRTFDERERATLRSFASFAMRLIEDALAERRREEIGRHRSTVLELTAADASLDRILVSIADYVDYALPMASSAVLVRRDDGMIAPYARPSTAAIDQRTEELGRQPTPFPAAYADAGILRLDRLGPESPKFPLYAALLDAGYRMTWRQPIVDLRGALRGAIVAHVPHDREPNPRERRTLQEATALAAIAIEADAARAHLERLALHDALTGLPNRTLLERRLDIERRDVSDGGPGFALAMLDIDRFKIINDNLGHAVGDQLIVEIGNRLRATTRTTDFVARLAGDEFLIILSDVADRETATLVITKILASLERQFAPGGHELFVRASVGIAFYPADTLEPAELMRRADLAMYAAKESGSRIGFAEASVGAGESALALETELNRAVEHDEFELVYQPSIDITHQRVTGAEALLRWRHPRLGTLAPGRFIPIAEQTGLIVPIGEWVLREACRFAKRWRDAGGPGIVSVNVSARQFEQRGFADTVVAAIDQAGIDASQLWLEVTETLIMRSPETTTATLAALRLRGVRSTIDDFGTGYSSLAYLKRYPIAGLKIDRAFVKDLGSAHEIGDGDRAIIATIVALGAALGLSIIAEGAETREQIEILRELGCEGVQGYYFARPMRPDALLEWCHHPSAIAPITTRA